MGPKINVKERFTDGEIDLSMSDLEEVPVKEIVQLKKAYSLDLSNNRLTLLPKTFASLTHLTKLDLSKNELRELPEDFGNLTKLKYLDLYQNQLQHLPMSFSKLKDLKWLDLKDNPLVPTVAKIAGPCLDTKQCQSCARDIVNFFVRLEKQVSSELETRNKTRQKQLEINQQKKQEEKKGKKKEKQKQKQEVAAVQKNDTGKGKSKKDNNKKNSKPAPKTNEASSSYIGKLFTVLFLTSVILFVLTSVKFKLTENVELFTRGLYAKGLEKLPPNLRSYGIEGGNVIYNFHEKTGNLILNVIKFFNNNVVSRTKCFELSENVKSLLGHFVSKVREIYHQIVPAQ